MSDKDRRTEELLVERALRPLDDRENWELDQLGAEDDDSYDLAVAAVAIATLAIEPMPRQVAERVLRTSQEFTAMKSVAGLELPPSLRRGEIRTLPGVAADVLRSRPAESDAVIEELPTEEKPRRRPSVAPDTSFDDATSRGPAVAPIRKTPSPSVPTRAPQEDDEEEEKETHRRGALPRTPQEAPISQTPIPQTPIPHPPIPHTPIPQPIPQTPAPSVAPARLARPHAAQLAPPVDELGRARETRRRSKLAVVAPWIAAAACLLLAVGTWWWQRQRGPSTVVATSAADARTALLARATDVTMITWTTTADPTAKGASGDVVWSEREQRGYMRFVGLAPNDPASFQYQLWIFDKNRDERFPVDGGVFDVASNGEVVIPISARLPVSDATLFAVTVEKPGGVVVSTRERIVVTAARKS